MSKLSDVILRDITANRPAAGVAGRLFFDTTLNKLQRDTGGAWQDCEGSSGTGYLGYIHVRDEKTATTEGGGYTTGSFATRDLNTEVSDTNGDCSLASNQMTLTAGTYDCLIRSPVFFIGEAVARLRNVTDGSTVLVGSRMYVPSINDQADLMVLGRFTIAASKALEVQVRGTLTRTSNGLGVGGTNLGEIAVFTSVELWRFS